MDASYFQKFVFKIAIILLIIGALNWLSVGVFKINPLEKVTGTNSWIARTIYFLVGASALYIMFNRDTYLPFLGETVLPCAALAEHTPENADIQLEVKVPPRAKVLYWAAEPSTEGLKKLNDWRGAYLKYMNMGVTTANSQGVAVLRVRHPQPYTVPWKGRLEPHIHFRICGDNGMLSRIKTVFLSDGHVEGFLP